MGMSTDTPDNASTTSLTSKERDLVECAIQELQDLTHWGTGVAADAGLEGLDAIEQVEMTREAVAAAMKAVTSFRRRVMRAKS